MTAAVDIAIVGDGLVGRPLALALVARGWRVALIDRAPRDAAVRAATALGEASLDERCTAISVVTRDRLLAEGLWDPLAVRAADIRRVHVSHRGHFGATRLAAADLGLDTLGVTFENRCLLASLDKKLRVAIEQASLIGCHGCALVELQQQPESVTLRLERDDGRRSSVSARLVIAADGAESTTRALLGIGARRHDYAQSALMTSVRLEREHHGVAIERFTDNGPLALLPRPHGVLNVVACVPPAQAERLVAVPRSEWLATLSRWTPGRLGRPLHSGARICVPLQRIEAETQLLGRCLLLGNAARLLHPVAGQGYNLAMRDVAAWLERLGDRASAAADPGEPERLARFVASRRADQRRTVQLTDALARTFRGSNSLVGHLRAASLVALDTLPPVRRAFARRAMGRSD